MAEEIGTYVLPVILSFDGVDKQVNSKLSKAFGTTGKQASAEFSKGAGEGLRALEKEVESAQKAYGRLADKAKDALDKITVEEKKLEKARSGGREDQIAAAEARLAKARRDSARAAKDAESGNRSLLDAQKRLGAGSDDLDGRFGKLSGSMRSVGTIAGGAALAGISALGAGVAVASRELYQLGSDFDEVSDNLQIKTGLSGKALDDLTDSVTRLGTTNVPSTFADISDVAAEVTRNLHLSGPELEEMASRLANLDRMGKDVDIRTFSKAVKGFGLDAQGQVGAINALNEISGKTGLSIDDMTSSLLANGASLRTLGLDFAEGAALVTTFEDAGLDADTMLKGLKKGSVEFAKDGKTASQGLRDTITEMQRLVQVGDEVGAQNLANKVFGAKNGQNFFDAIRNGKLDLQSLSGSLHLTGLDINQVSADTADWSEKWQLLKNDVADALGPLAADVFDGVNGKLTDLSDWVTTHQGEVIDFFVGFGETAISAAEVTTSAFAGVVEFFKLFDDIVMNMTSWLPGYDDEAAEAFNNSLGDLSDKLSGAADSGLWQSLRENLREFGAGAKDAAGNSDALGTSVAGIGAAAGGSIADLRNLKSELTSLPPLPAGVGLSPQEAAGRSGLPAPVGQLPGLPPLTPGAGGRGAGLNLQIAANNAGGVPRKLGSDSGLLPQTVGVKDNIASKFTDISDIGGFRNDPNYPNEHPAGKALDVMIPNWSTPQGLAYGNQVAEYALQQPGVDYVLWQQKQWNRDGTSSPMSDLGNPTANHRDHVHVHVEPGSSSGAHPQGTPKASLSSASTSLNFPATATSGLPDSTTQSLNNAFGTDFKAGIGTPGYNEYGEPGYYETDAKAIRQAEQQIADAQERVKRADQQTAEAEARLAELDADASESQRLSAQNAVDNAKADAEKARREAEDAKADAAETARGTFKAAEKAAQSSGSSGQGGLGQFGELGSILGSGLKETFGIDGSFLPDLSNSSSMQMLNAGLNAFAGPLQGLVDGKLGIQQPGWSPGMPVPGMETSSGAFGMPNVAVPPMPAPGAHPGSGAAPGPAGATTIIDASQNFNGNVGWDPAEAQRVQRAAQARAEGRASSGPFLR